MMNENDSNGFKIRINGEEEDLDAEFKEDVTNRQLSKLNQRVTLISILIPCLFIVIILYFYLDTKKDVTTTFNTGSQEIHNLSKHLESRYSELVGITKQIEETFAKKSEAMEKSVTDLEKEVQGNTKTGKDLESSKATKSSLSSSIVRVNRTIGDIKETLDTFSDERQKADKQIEDRLIELVDIISTQKKQIESLQKTLSSLSSDKIDKSEFNHRLDEMQKTYNQRLDRGIKNLGAQILSLERRIIILEGGNPENTLPPTTSNPAVPQTGISPDKSESLKPGMIIEQDIQ